MMQANDIAMLADMARYMRNDYSSLGGSYSAASFPHANIPHMYWWDWNANSGDTGGIVQDDWKTVRSYPSCRHPCRAIHSMSCLTISCSSTTFFHALHA